MKEWIFSKILLKRCCFLKWTKMVYIKKKLLVTNKWTKLKFSTAICRHYNYINSWSTTELFK